MEESTRHASGMVRPARHTCFEAFRSSLLRLAGRCAPLRERLGLPRPPHCWVLDEGGLAGWRSRRYRALLRRSLGVLPATREWRVARVVHRARMPRDCTAAASGEGWDLAARAQLAGRGTAPGDVLVDIRRGDCGDLEALLEPWARITSRAMGEAAVLQNGIGVLPLREAAPRYLDVPWLPPRQDPLPDPLPDPGLAACVLALHVLQRRPASHLPEENDVADAARPWGIPYLADLTAIAQAAERALAEVAPLAASPRGRALERLAVWAALVPVVTGGEVAPLRALEGRLTVLARRGESDAARDPVPTAAAIRRLLALARLSRAMVQPAEASRHLAEALAAAAEARLLLSEGGPSLSGVSLQDHLARAAALEGRIAARLAALTGHPTLVLRAEAAREVVRAIAEAGA